MDALSGPFISPNIKSFQCDSCPDISAHKGLVNSTNQNYTDVMMTGSGQCDFTYGNSDRRTYQISSDQCHFDYIGSSQNDRALCSKWSYDNPDNNRFMHSLSIEQNLVCDREWLKSFTNSMYFVGQTLGLLFWGVISDRYGRKTAYVISHFVTIIFGFSALFANSMCSYIILRTINSFGMIGELIPRSIQVEIVATEYRFICSIVCQTGWALGIILVPALSYVNPGYRFILAVPVGLSILM